VIKPLKWVSMDMTSVVRQSCAFQMPDSGTSNDRRDRERSPSLLVVNFRLPGREAFIERYASNVSENGIFVVTSDVHPIGTRITFELRTMDGAAALRGEGTIAWARTGGDDSAEPPGLGIAFTRIDPENRALVVQMVEAARRAPQAGAVPAASPGEAAVNAWLATLSRSRRRRGWTWAAGALALALAASAAALFALQRKTAREEQIESEPPLSQPVMIGSGENDAGV
jgi:uncharacterized protein (TIGR02266 family)